MHHTQFDAKGTFWTSGGGDVIGWLDTKKFDATGDAAQSQGWTAFILETNGNGERGTECNSRDGTERKVVARLPW